MKAPDAPCKDEVQTAASANCLYGEWKKADSELNGIYGSVRRVLEPNEMIKLRSAQRIWLQFRDADCAAAKSLYEGGTAVGPAYNGCMEAVTRQRVTELNAMYGWRIEKILSLSSRDFALDEGNCTKRDASSRPDCPQAITFFEQLKAALKSGNRDLVTSMVGYPLLAFRKGTKVYIRDRTELLKDFDEIFDAGVTCAIQNAGSSQVWGNSHGFTIGRGEIWFDGILPQDDSSDVNASDYWTKYPIKLITVNDGDKDISCQASQ